MKKDSAIFLMLLMAIFFVKQNSGCCCTIWDVFPCYCNIFGCNCENPYGTDNCWVMGNDHVVECVKGKELCPDKRMKRSIDPVMENIMNNSQYNKLYGHLIGIPALEVFYYHDLNKVPIIFYFDMYHIFLFRMA